MLWTDADFISADDLVSLDAEVKDVASVESITLEGDNGIIHRAIEEAGDTILKHMQVWGASLVGAGGVTSNHWAAVMNTGLDAVHQSKVLLTQVVVSSLFGKSWSAVKRWAAYWALMAFYRDAANRTNNDRYRVKQETYHGQLHNTYWEAVRSTGLPVAIRPLPCPGALYELNAGTWGNGNVSAVDGPGVGGSYDVVVTWADSLQTNGESGPSARATATLEAGKVAQVDIGTLLPPTGAQPRATVPLAVVTYGRATHWNVYAGPSGGVLRLQNAAPIPVGTQTYTLTGDPALTTPAVGTGQYPEQYLHFTTPVRRG